MTADPSMQRYFSDIERHLSELYEIAEGARSKGLDPHGRVEIYKAEDLAARVEGLIGVRGVAKRIRELSAQVSREEAAFKIIEEIVNGKFGEYEEEEAADIAMRTALALMTEGITAAPLQGIEKVKICQSAGTRYLAVYYAGPIRSAGGTEQALTVLFADYLRILLHLDKYRINEQEIGRFIEELRLYERKVARFQYHPSDEELRHFLRCIPVEVTGSPTDEYEVSVYRNLPRIDTNRVRGGALRVINDGVYGKAAKLKKIVDKVGISGWDWLKVKKEDKRETSTAIMPDIKYLVDIVGGRPIFSHPSRFGGFRLRYGRARNTGLASVGIHPATMVVLESFIAIGTQLRVERPGKSSTITPVDTIETPIVKLKSGDVIRVEDEVTAERVKGAISEILFLGDMVVSYGEFLENNHRLMPAGYCEEIWAGDLRRAVESSFGGDYGAAADHFGMMADRLRTFVERPLMVKPTPEEAITISRGLFIPLHPRYTYFWENVSTDELKVLREWLEEPIRARMEAGGSGKLVASSKAVPKQILDKACVPHRVIDGKIVFEDAAVMEALFSWRGGGDAAAPAANAGRGAVTASASSKFLSEASGIMVRDKGRSFIGARMGRPEKAKERIMRPPIHVLFPIGLAGGAQRDISKAMDTKAFQVAITLRKCAHCKDLTYENVCRKCGAQTALAYACQNCRKVFGEERTCPDCRTAAKPYLERMITIDMYERLLGQYGLTKDVLIKGVKGLSNPSKVPENIEKGILRSKHKIYVYKDGTVRFDITNAPLTHFKPSEVRISIERLRQLGYDKDCYGEELTDPDQLLELRVQDIIVPEKCKEYLYRTSRYVDEMLVKVYKMQPYYCLKAPEDIVGHLVIGLAPHTSAGIAGRIIGFTKAAVCYAHPFWHAAKRRNCDGDEDAVMLALEALIDFSREYLPERIGGLMDAPLVMTTTIDPSEVDDECHNMETVDILPREFYELAEQYREAKEALAYVETIKSRLGTPDQYRRFWFSIPTESVERGPITTAYDKLKTMSDKVEKQLQLADKIRAVDGKDVAERLLKHHFIPDLAGNMRAFSTQTFRCTKCGAKYRRVPLRGSCLKCSGGLTLTVHEGNVSKYLEAAFALSKRYELGVALDQQICLVERGLVALIPPKKAAKSRNMDLGDFIRSQ